MRKRLTQSYKAYLFLLPAFSLWVLFAGWPFIEVIRLSLVKTNFITTEFVGLQNFIKTLSSTSFWGSLGNTLFYAVLILSGELLVVICISLLGFHMTKKWQDWIRLVVYIPVLSAGIIIAQVWKWIYHVNGPINFIFEKLGFDKIAFFNTSAVGIPAISIIMVYQCMGAFVILLMANMLSINKEILDAAKIDGANTGQINRKIILPMMARPISMLSLLMLISAFQFVETIMMLAPYEHTANITYHIYQEAFVFSRYGIGSAQAILLMILIIGLTLLKNRVEKNG